MNTSPFASDGLLLHERKDRPWSLSDLCAWLAPAVDVNLTVERDGDRVPAVAAMDWVNLDAEELFARISNPEDPVAKMRHSFVAEAPGLEKNLRLIEDRGGNTLGRALIHMTAEHTPLGGHIVEVQGMPGLITVGGLRAAALNGIAGILVGRSQRASRDAALPTVSKEMVAEWATDQATLLRELPGSAESKSQAAEVVWVLGGDTADLPVARDSSGWVTVPDIATKDQPDEVVLVQDASIHILGLKHSDLSAGVYMVDVGALGIVGSSYSLEWPPHSVIIDDEPWFHEHSLKGLVIEALAKAWGVELSEVLKASEVSTDYHEVVREVGRRNGKGVEDTVDVIRRPA